MIVIKEFLINQLEKFNIFEMAYDKRHFQIKADNYKEQLVQNWILIRYCSKTNTNLDLRSHWCSELYNNYCKDLFYDNLKGDDKKCSLKKKYLKSQWLNYSELDSDKFRLKGYITSKLSDEKTIEWNINIINQCIEEFMNEIHILIDYICCQQTDKNELNLKKYIYEIL